MKESALVIRNARDKEHQRQPQHSWIRKQHRLRKYFQLSQTKSQQVCLFSSGCSGDIPFRVRSSKTYPQVEAKVWWLTVNERYRLRRRTRVHFVSTIPNSVLLPPIWTQRPDWQPLVNAVVRLSVSASVHNARFPQRSKQTRATTSWSSRFYQPLAVLHHFIYRKLWRGQIAFTNEAKLLIQLTNPLGVQASTSSWWKRSE